MGRPDNPDAPGGVHDIAHDTGALQQERLTEDHMRAICDRLGRSRIAAAVGVGRASVSNAIRAGGFPAPWYAAIADLAFQSEIPVDLRWFIWRRGRLPETARSAHE